MDTLLPCRGEYYISQGSSVVVAAICGPESSAIRMPVLILSKKQPMDSHRTSWSIESREQSHPTRHLRVLI